MGNCIDIANAILKNQKRVKSDYKFYYSMQEYRKNGSFNILNNIFEQVTLVQLIYFVGNVSHAISVFGYCIFDLNYEKSLALNR